MHVDVDAARVDLEEQHVGRLALAVQQLRVGLAHRVREQPVAHVAAVDEEVLAVGALARRLRRAGAAVEAQRARLRFDRRLFVKKLSPSSAAARSAGGCARRTWLTRPLCLSSEGDAGARERDAAEHLVAMAELGRLGAQELAARRRIEIEVGDRDRGALRARRGLDFADLRAFGADRGARAPRRACGW